MHNVPQDLNDETLEKHLSTSLNDLNISTWSCSKPRKKKYGWLTFLDARDGDKFLRQHGEVPIPGAPRKKGKIQKQARLMILSAPVYCMVSRHPPEPFLLRVLDGTVKGRHEAEAVQQQHQQKQHQQQ